MSNTAIRKYRRAQWIAEYKPVKSYKNLTRSQSDSIQARLGKEPASIASDFGVSNTAIRKCRRAQRIAEYKPCKAYNKLTRSQSGRVQARLRKESDVSIAADFGVSNAAIWKRRSAQGNSEFKPCESNGELTRVQIDSTQARLEIEPDATTEADVEATVNAIWERWFAQRSTVYKPLKSRRSHQPPNIILIRFQRF